MFTLRIQPGSTAPIWRQIVNGIAQAEADGRLSPGDTVPSVRDLAEQLVINHNTVAKAYTELVRDGIILGQAGRGYVVAKRRMVFSSEEKVRQLDQSLDAVVGLAARLGGMQLGREILALEVLGHDPARYVLTPSLVAVVAAAPIHLLVAGVCAWFASGSVLQFGAVTPWPQFMALTLGDATAKAALTGMAKAVVFSVVALGVGAAIGAREVRGPADVGGQATAAFTFGLLSVFAAGACWQVIG